MVTRDTGGRVSCSAKGLSASIWKIGWVSVMDEGEKMEVDDIAIIMEGIEDVGMKSGESEQGIV